MLLVRVNPTDVSEAVKDVFSDDDYEQLTECLPSSSALLAKHGMRIGAK